MAEKDILARTYFDKFNVYRKETTVDGEIKRQIYTSIYSDKKCALSRGGGNRNIVRTGVLVSIDYQAVLFCEPEFIIQPGDRIVVTLRDGIREYAFDAGEPIVYNSHQEIPLSRSVFVVIPGNMTCLVYNRTVVSGGIKYKPYLLSNVFYENSISINPVGQINEPSNLLKVGISYSDDYKIPPEYQNSPSGAFTLQKGDVIVINSDYSSTEYDTPVDINQAFNQNNVFLITDIIEHIIPYDKKIHTFEVIAK